jgi:hypothetical protein
MACTRYGSRAVAYAIARALLVALALVLPFEAPLFSLFGLQLTSVEVLLYAMLTAWGAAVGLSLLAKWPSRAEVGRFVREPLVAATLAFAGAELLSAAVAPSLRAAALKFALRSLSGILVFFAARTLAATETVAPRVSLALALGAVLSALTALLDAVAPSTGPVWSHFRDAGFNAFGFARAAGVFAYPTIGAMYWEALAPLVVVLAALGVTRLTSGRALAGMAASAVLFGAIIASGTRSSLAGVALTAGAMRLLARQWSPTVARAGSYAVGVLALTSLLAVGLAGRDSLLAQRLRFWEDKAWFGAEYSLPTEPRTVNPGEVFATRLTLRNTGTLTWRHDGPQRIRLAHRWYLTTESGTTSMPIPPGRQRTEILVDVPPGGVTEVTAFAEAPAVAGSYALAWDLVQEDVAWFGETGNRVPVVEIDVGARGQGAAARPSSTAIPAPVGPAVAPAPPGRLALWRAAVLLWRSHPLLGNGPDTFRRLYEDVIGLGPRGEPFTDTRIHANSLYFETLADLGLLGLGALLALMAALGRSLWRSSEELCLGLGLAAAAFFIHGTSDYFLEFTPTFGLHWMLLGLVAARSVPGGRAPTR